jgi:hypothetical protein
MRQAGHASYERRDMHKEFAGKTKRLYIRRSSKVE